MAAALELDPGYVRALLRRAQLYEASEQLDQALLDYQHLLEAQPGHPEARAACMVPHTPAWIYRDTDPSIDTQTHL